MLTIKGKNDETLTHGIVVADVACCHCHLQILPEHGKFIAIDEPYNALLHWKCAPLFSYSGEWPHNKPLVSYTAATDCKPVPNKKMFSF